MSLILDLIVVAVIVLFSFRGYRKGLILTVYGVASFVIAVVVSLSLYPHVSRLIRENTGLYENIKASAGASVAGRLQELGGATAEEAISGMDFPPFIRDALLRNNNAVVNNVLGSFGVQDYIAGSVANIAINAVSLVAVFIITFIALKIAGIALRIVSRLPVIHTFDKYGGGIAGFFQGILVVWLLLTVFVMFVTFTGDVAYFEILNDSNIAKVVQERNFVFRTVVDIFY
jgi:uncharacterized membrane protein required for colicin V production